MPSAGPVEHDFRTALEMGFFSQCMAVSACALFMYDRFITIGQEIRLGCGRRVSVASALCWLMQLSVFMYLWVYMAIIPTTSCQRLGPPPAQETIALTNHTTRSGHTLDVILNIAAAAFHASVGAISALRAYGINGRSIWMPSIILTLTLVGSSIDIYKSLTLITTPVPLPVGCALLWANSSNAIQNVVWLSGQISSTVAEVLVLATTWHAAYGLKQTARQLKLALPMTTLILRDGTLYFSIVIVVLILNGLLNHVKSNSFTTPLTYALQSIIISRFFRDLRKAALMPDTIASSPSQMTDVHFSRVLGNLGGSLSYDTEETENQDADGDDMGQRDERSPDFEMNVM